MLNDLEKLLKPKVRMFCEIYLSNGGNGTEAALAMPTGGTLLRRRQAVFCAGMMYGLI